MLGSSYPGVAQFGSALEWGSRGREFDSRHSDQKTSSTGLVFFLLSFVFWLCNKKIILR